MNREEIKEIPKEQFEPAPIDHEAGERLEKPQLSFMKDAWLRVRKNKAAIVSLIILALIVIMAIIDHIFRVMMVTSRMSRKVTFHRVYQF